MTIEELAKRKAELNMRLEALSYTNVAGATVEFMTDLNMEQIKAKKELNDIKRQIDAYIKAD